MVDNRQEYESIPEPRIRVTRYTSLGSYWAYLTPEQLQRERESRTLNTDYPCHNCTGAR